MGNWIGGDRDGNPFVDAGTLRAAFAKQSETALRHYLTQVHELGAELSNSATLQPVTAEMQRLADASGDASAHREDEPYRRALIGVYARLAALLHRATGTEALRRCARDPLRGGERIPRDTAHDRGALARPSRRSADRPALAPLIRAKQVFGFHLATVDCARAPTRRGGRAELLAVARIEATTRARRSRARRDCRTSRRVRTAGVVESAAQQALRRASTARAALFEGAEMLRRYGREALRHDHLAHRERERLLEVLVLLEGGRAAPAARSTTRMTARR